MDVTEVATYKNITASTLIRTGRGKLLGVFVASGSAPTLKFWDNTSAAAPIIVNTFTPYIGVYTALPFEFTTGLYCTVGGTADVTIAWQPAA